jgi:uroporphyrinogen-III synthase
MNEKSTALKVKNIIISQPKPPNYEKSPYFELSKKYNLNIIFKKFIKIDPVSAQEFRRSKINITEHSAVIFTCNNAVDHYFRLCKEMRLVVPESTKYFCISEKTAFYLQKYVQFRKRKIFHGKENTEELISVLKKHPDEKFLLPCTEDHKQEIVNHLADHKINVRKAIIYKTVSELEVKEEVQIEQFDMLVFFSPFGIKSLFENYPDFEQKSKIIAAWGNTTQKQAKEAGLKINIQGPTDTITSMPMAIEAFLEKNKK